MKKVIFGILLFISLLNPSLQAQVDNVVVLVDVSGSVKRYVSNPEVCSEVIADVVEGQAIKNSSFKLELLSGGTITNPLVDAGKKILIVPFGDRPTDAIAKGAKAVTLNGVSDVRNILNVDYPKVFNDNKTYRTLALARCAQVALQNGMQNYWLFVVSDETGDAFMGAAAGYNTEQQSLIDSYKSPTNRVDETKYGIIKFASNNVFKIDVFKVNLSGYIPPPPTTVPTTPTKDTVRNCKISLASLAGGTLNVPKEVSTLPVGLSWNCNCPAISEFRVNISGIEGSKVDNSLRSKKYSTNSTSLNLANGKYRISVSADGASSDSTVIEVSTGSGGILWFLLLLLLAGGVIYFIRSRNRSERSSSSRGSNSERRKPQNNDDEFS